MMRASGGLGSAGVGQPETNSAPRWERTPWWKFWRPAWRLWVGAPNYSAGGARWEYQTHRQRARDALSKAYGGHSDNAGSEHGSQQGGWAPAQAPRFNSGGYGRIEH